jgi:hypothetical protein
MGTRWRWLVFTLLTLCLLTAGLLLLSASHLATPPAQAHPGELATLYVSSVSGDDANPCTSDAPCRTIQRAAGQAGDGDQVWIATLDNATLTVYTGTGGAAVVTLDQGLTLRGGYTYFHAGSVHIWTPSPFPAPLDGEGARRTLYISGDVTPTVEILSLVNGSAADGGNACIEGSHARLLGLLIENGTATRGGGLYLHDSAALLSGVLIENNQATEGGGLYLDGGSANVLGGWVRGNSAERGGGFYGLDSAVRVFGALVVSNTASQAGGGCYLDGPLTINPLDVPILASGYIRHNQAPEGAGVYLHLAVAGLVNNVITNNESTGHGGALYLYASSPQGFHNTVGDNAGLDAIYLTHQPGSWWPPLPPVPSLPTFTNTVVVSEVVGVYVDSTELFPPLENKATLRGTLWHANGQDTAGPGDVDLGSTNVHGNPLFTCRGDPPACLNPYHLQGTSPAVDAGVPIALTLPGTDLFIDIDGQLRPSGAGYDIGADEVQQPGGVWLLPPLSVLVATPGQVVTHTHWLVNSGTTTDSYTLTLGATPGWSGLATPWPIELGPQTTATVRVRVTVPATATAGMTETGLLTAISWNEPLRRAYALEETTVVTAAWADLSLGKWADQDVVPPGEAVHFTLAMTNAGPFSGTIAVTLTDAAVPTVAISAIYAPPGCSADAATGRVTCTLTLPAGAPPVSTSLEMVITTSGSYSGPLLDSALLTGDVFDPNLFNNAAQALVTVGLPGPAIAVDPAAVAVTLTVGLSTTRDLTISSVGTADLTWALLEVPPVPWLEEAPLSGTLAPSESVAVELRFDAAGLAADVYTASLEVLSNDLQHPLVPVAGTLTVQPACAPVSEAAFTWEPPEPAAGQPVTFTAVATGTPPLAFTWSFGDGTTGQGTPVGHVYTAWNVYTVVLTATNGCGQAWVAHGVTVWPAPPAYRIYLPLMTRQFGR